MEENVKEYDYLKIFDEIFFNIDDNCKVKNIIFHVNVIFSTLIYKFGEVDNELAYKDNDDIGKEHGYTHIVVLQFIRKIMEQIDAINVLYSKCIFTQSDLILRSLVENVVSLEFILKENTDFRAAAYFLQHHYEEITLGHDIEEGKRGIDIKNHISEEEYNNLKMDLDKKEKKFRHLIDNNPLFTRVDQAREKHINNDRRKRAGKWYSWDGPENFKELMHEVELEKYYTGIYGTLSFETHALNTTMSMKFNDDGSFTPDYIRSPIGGGNTFSLTCTFALSALRNIYTYLGDGVEEKMEFVAFYQEFREKQAIIEKRLGMII